METDFNPTTQTCLDDEPEETTNLNELQKTALLQRVEQEFNTNSLVKKKRIRVQIVYNASFPDGYQIKISPECKNDKQGEKKLCFGFRGSKELLTPVILEIDRKINLFPDPFLVHVFVDMLICDDLTKFIKKLPISCMTIEFGYLVEKFKPYCKSFNPTTIEKSGLFVSKGGHIITANSLYNTMTDNLHTKTIIDNIIKKML